MNTENDIIIAICIGYFIVLAFVLWAATWINDTHNAQHVSIRFSDQPQLTHTLGVKEPISKLYALRNNSNLNRTTSPLGERRLFYFVTVAGARHRLQAYETPGSLGFSKFFATSIQVTNADPNESVSTAASLCPYPRPPFAQKEIRYYNSQSYAVERARQKTVPVFSKAAHSNSTIRQLYGTQYCTAGKRLSIVFQPIRKRDNQLYVVVDRYFGNAILDDQQTPSQLHLFRQVFTVQEYNQECAEVNLDFDTNAVIDTGAEALHTEQPGITATPVLPQKAKGRFLDDEWEVYKEAGNDMVDRAGSRFRITSAWAMRSCSREQALV